MYTISDLGRLFSKGRLQPCGCDCDCRACKDAYRWKCGGRMLLRINLRNKDLFWGCSSYPDCTNTYPFSIGDIPLDLRRRL